MKKAISLIMIILMIFSIAVFTVSCDDTMDQIEVEKNPPNENNEDKENTWNKDGAAIGHPVTIPTN